jgi:hypothetical protein
VIEDRLGPWPNLAAAQSFLRFLAGTETSFDVRAHDINYERWASWLVEHGLGPPAYARCRHMCPELASYLEADAYSAAGENSMHWQNLEQMSADFAEANIPIVLLKGAALAETVYGGRDRRTMSDVDLWLRQSDVERACRIMGRLGFYTAEKEERPLVLQMMSAGEIQFFRKGWQHSLAEFHMSPFSGWWLNRTTAIDGEPVWSRKEPLNGWASVYQLAAEDTLIHVAVHMTVNHQCGFWAVRSLLDLALTASKRTINWETVAERAKQWRVANAVWLALQLLQQLFGVRGLENALKKLVPPFWPRRYLQKLVTPESIILGADLRSGRIRYLYLLLLVDRKRDMFRLIFRTLWPEKMWLFNRYGSSASHWQHLNQFLRHGQI